jgi:catechol 2,3-dioxygenase-like lactoylglutathione lyase family enzyme
MELTDIQHIAIKTNDLEATNKFYVDVLGMKMADRPDFNFPGSWLQMGNTMFHTIAGDDALDEDGSFTSGTAALDHIALGAKGFDAYRDKFENQGMVWKENDIPSFGLWQLFVKDPNGITIELNFLTSDEPENSIGVKEASVGNMVRL